MSEVSVPARLAGGLLFSVLAVVFVLLPARAKADLPDGRYCVENTVGGFLYDGLDLASRCQAGEEWDVYRGPGTGGGYCLRTARYQTHLSHTGKNAFLQGPCNGAAERWTISEQSDGTYCIRNTRTDKFLSDRFPDSLHEHCSAGERWRFTPVGTVARTDATARIRPEPGRYCLRDASGTYLTGISGNGSPVGGTACEGAAIWRIYPPEIGPGEADGNDRFCVESEGRIDHLENRGLGILEFGPTCFDGRRLWHFLGQADGSVCILNDERTADSFDSFVAGGRAIGKPSPLCSPDDRWTLEPMPYEGQEVGRMVAFFGGVDRCEDVKLRNGAVWHRPADLNGRLILGTIHGGLAGTVRGAAVTKSETSPTHRHRFRVDIPLKRRGLAGASGGKGRLAQRRTIHVDDKTESVPSPDGAGGWPFMQLLACQERPEHAGKTAAALPPQSVAFFNSPACPEEWEPFKALNGRFVMPRMFSSDQSHLDLQKGGAVLGESLYGRTAPTLGHYHGVEIGPTEEGKSERVNLDFDPTSVGLASGSNTRADRTYPVSSGGTVSTERTDSAGGPILPYVELLACRKFKGRTQGPRIPEGLTAFTTNKDCETDMPAVQSSLGHYLMGLPNDPGAISGVAWGNPLKSGVEHSHRHPVEIKVGLTRDNVAEFIIARSGNLADPNKDYVARGFTKTTAFTPPYVTLGHCWRPIRAIGKAKPL